LRDPTTPKRVEKLKTNLDERLNGQHIKVEIWIAFLVGNNKKSSLSKTRKPTPHLRMTRTATTG